MHFSPYLKSRLFPTYRKTVLFVRIEKYILKACLRMEINWTDHVRNEEVLLRVSEQKNILHEIRKRKANWIGHIYVETAF
jgi:hypothetical protein